MNVRKVKINHRTPPNCRFCAVSALKRLSHIVGGAAPSLDFQLMRFEFLQAVIFPSVFAAMVMLVAHANSTVCFILSNPAAESLNCFTSFTYPRKKQSHQNSRKGKASKSCVVYALPLHMWL